jgi:hypothetical protein
MPALIIFLGTRFLSQFVWSKRNCTEADAVFGSLAFAYVLLAFVIFAMGVPRAIPPVQSVREAGGSLVSTSIPREVEPAGVPGPLYFA